MSSSTDATWWERFWFQPGPERSLVFVRAVVYLVLAASALHDVRFHFFTSVANRPQANWSPISILAPFDIPAPTRSLLVGVALVAAVAAVVTVIGVLPRLTGTIASLAGLFILVAENSYGKINHNKSALAFMLIVVLFAPALGVLRRRSHVDSADFRWPVVLCQAGFATMLLFAAWSKMRSSGLDWILTENMRNVLVSEILIYRDPAFGGIGLWAAEEPWRWRSIAALSVASEAAMVAFLFVRKPLYKLASFAAGAGVVIGINYITGLGGWHIVALLAVFLDAGRIPVGGSSRGRWLAAGSMLVLAAVVLFIRPPWTLLIPAIAVATLAVVLAIETRSAKNSTRDRVTDVQPPDKIAVPASSPE